MTSFLVMHIYQYKSPVRIYTYLLHLARTAEKQTKQEEKQTKKADTDNDQRAPTAEVHD